MDNTSNQSLRQHSFTQGLTDEEVNQLDQLLKRREFEVNDFIVEEGDHTTDLYLILEGEVSILKWDDERHFQLPLGKLDKGEVFGEMSFMDSSPRSTSIKAIKHTVTGALSPAIVHDYTELYNKIVTNIAIININRLRKSNQAQIKNLRSAVSQLQIRNNVGVFIFLFLISLGLLQFLTQAILVPYLSQFGWVSPYIQELGWFLLLIPTFYLIRSFSFKYSELGVTSSNGGKTVLEGVLAVILGGILLLVGSWFYTNFYKPVNPTAILTLPFVVGYFIYCCVREFLARGVLQSTIERYLGDQRGFQTVWLTALLLNVIIFPMNALAFISFVIADLILGSFYFHQKTLIGVILIHFLLGLIVLQKGIMVFY